MSSVRHATWLALFVLWIAPLLAAAQVPDETKAPTFHLVAPTRYRNLAPGRSDALRLEIREVPLAETGELLSKLRAVLPAPRWRRLVICVYVAAGRTKEEQAKIVESVREEFRKAYPDTKLKIKTRVLEPQLGPQELSAKIEETLQDIDSNYTDEQTKKMTGALREANAEALAETVDKLKEGEGAEGLIEQLENPSTTRRVVGGFAWLRAFVVLTSRVAQVATDAVQGGGIARGAGLALIAGDSAAEYFTVRFQTLIGKYFAEHGIPGAWRSGFLDKLGRYYRASPVAQYAKATVLNLLAYGLGRPLLMQQLGHLASPSSVPAVTADDAGDLLTNNLMGTAAYTCGFQACETLRQKGWMSAAHIDLAFRLLGMLDVATNLLNSNPHLRHYRVFTQGPAWGAYLLAFAASWFLPIRNERFVLIDERLTGARDSVNALEVTDSTRTIPKQDNAIAQAVSDVRRLQPIRRGWCGKLLSVLKRSRQ